MVSSRLAKRFNLADYAYAHRGLWRESSPPENSLSACLAAAEAGFGIEFDVRPSADGHPVVFHDETLDRMTAQNGRVEEMTAAALQEIQLHESGDKIPSLDALLSVWPATTPLLCELKIDGATDPITFAEQVGEMLLQYEGPAAAMSFSIAAVGALPAKLMKGQLITPSALADGAWHRETLESLEATKPDYIAPHVIDAAAVSTNLLSSRLPRIVWTVRDEAIMRDIKDVADAQIFENLSESMVKSICGSTL